MVRGQSCVASGDSRVCCSLYRYCSAPEPSHNLPEAVEPGFEVLDDLLSELVRLGEVVDVGQARIPEPEETQAGLVAGHEIVMAVAAPASVRVLLLMPGGSALVPILWVVAFDELGEMFEAHRLLLQRVVDVRPVVVVPDLFRPGAGAGLDGLYRFIRTVFPRLRRETQSIDE